MNPTEQANAERAQMFYFDSSAVVDFLAGIKGRAA
jgi:hypothetical protein